MRRSSRPQPPTSSAVTPPHSGARHAEEAPQHGAPGQTQPATPGGPDRTPCAACPHAAPKAPRMKRPSPARDQAEALLDVLTANGPVAVEEAVRRGKAAGFSAATLRRAQARRGRPFKSATPNGPWMWPSRATTSRQAASRAVETTTSAPEAPNVAEPNVAEDDHQAVSDLSIFDGEEESDGSAVAAGGRTAPSRRPSFEASDWGRELTKLERPVPGHGKRGMTGGRR